MKVLEDPANLKLMNDAELSLHADQKKIELYAEKEQLLYAMDEKSHETDLTEKGRTFMSPQDPDAFVLPDLSTAMHDIDAGPEPDAPSYLGPPVRQSRSPAGVGNGGKFPRVFASGGGAELKLTLYGNQS